MMIFSLATGGLKYNFYVASLFQSDWSMCKVVWILFDYVNIINGFVLII